MLKTTRKVITWPIISCCRLIGKIVVGYFGKSRMMLASSEDLYFKIMTLITIIITIPITTIALIVISCIFIDQITYPKNDVNPAFIDTSLKSKDLSEKGIILLDAMCYQLEKELNSTFGWTPNDIFVLRFFDNNLNRQKGVIHSTREFAIIFAEKISKYGFGDRENIDLKNARQSSFALNETKWGYYNTANAEESYIDGIRLIREFQDRLRSKRVRINISTSDLYDILVSLKKMVLAEPLGRLQDSSQGVSYADEEKQVNLGNKSEATKAIRSVRSQDKVPFSELDDSIYYAQGAAIVARDVLSVLFYAFYPVIVEKGAEENMRMAIHDLNAAAELNPYLVVRSRENSSMPDYRAKMAWHYYNASSRIDEVINSINR